MRSSTSARSRRSRGRVTALQRVSARVEHPGECHAGSLDQARRSGGQVRTGHRSGLGSPVHGRVEHFTCLYVKALGTSGPSKLAL